MTGHISGHISGRISGHSTGRHDPTVLGRRTLLALVAGSGLGLLVGCSSGPTDEERACGIVQGAVDDVPAGLLAIGARYRQLHPDDDLHAIGDGLAREDQAGDEQAGDARAGALARLSEQVRTDFEDGDVVTVDGWVLARTEARAAALLVDC